MGGQARRPPGAIEAGCTASRPVGGEGGVNGRPGPIGRGSIRRGPIRRGTIGGGTIRRGPIGPGTIGRGTIGRRGTAGPAGCLDRQPDLETGPLRRAARPDLPAVRHHDPMGDRQPQARPGAGRMPPPLRFERRRGQVRRQPGAVVADADHDLAAPAGLRRDADPGSGRVVPDRVVEHVDEHLFQPVMVSPDGGQCAMAGDLDHRRARLGQAGDGRLQHQRDVAPVMVQPQDPRLDGGEVEQVADEPAQPRRLGGDPAQEPVLRGGVPRHVGLQQAGRVTADGGERGAQFVAQPGQEAPLELLRPAQRGRLLVGQGRRLPLQGQPQRVGGVLHQRHRVRGGQAGPAGHQDRRPARRRERHRQALAAIGAPRPAVVLGARERPGRGVGHRRGRLARPVASGMRPAARCAAGGLAQQRHLIGLQAAPQRPQRHLEPLGHRDGAGQRLQHLPDRLQHPVARGDLFEQPVPLHRARGVAGVHRHQVKLVPLRAAGRWPEHGDHADQPAGPQHRHRP